jgi:hypothetical protein
MAQKTHPYLSVLQYSSDGIVAYTALTDIKLITPNAIERGTSKITNLSSTNQWHEYLAGWKEPGKIAFAIYYHQTQFNTVFGTLFALSSQTAPYFWQILFPLLTGQSNNAYLKFQGILNEIKFNEMTIENDDAITCPCSLQATSQVTFTAGS